MNGKIEESHREKAKFLPKTMKINSALLIVIAVSLVLVAFSYLLYYNSGYYKYDLARPDIKPTVKVGSEQGVADVYSPVDSKAVQEAEEFIKIQQKTLDSLGSFDKEPLSNQALTLE